MWLTLQEKSNLLPNTTSPARFTREAEITVGLEHPGIVPVYGLGAYPDGRPFYAMRFIRGKSLHDAIKAYHSRENTSPTEQNLELRRLLKRFIDVCEAIDYAHSRGVLHRDLKPGNIMLGRYEETLVVDWGLAKALGETPKQPAATSEETKDPSVSQLPEPPLVPGSHGSSGETMLGSALGTIAYMSPEQANGRRDLLGPESDVFSLGATLFHLLTGQPPYTGNRNEAYTRARAGEYPRPRSITRDIPAPSKPSASKPSPSAPLTAIPLLNPSPVTSNVASPTSPPSPSRIHPLSRDPLDPPSPPLGSRRRCGTASRGHHRNWRVLLSTRNSPAESETGR